jgi:hypothetical protein
MDGEAPERVCFFFFFVFFLQRKNERGERGSYGDGKKDWIDLLVLVVYKKRGGVFLSFS